VHTFRGVRHATQKAGYRSGMHEPTLGAVFVIYLASASPRRSQLLAQIGVLHRVVAVDIDESRRTDESPEDYVKRLAAEKSQSLWARLAPGERLPVLGADTTVALGDETFGKPASKREGLAMLARLAARTHQVFTAVALRSERGCDLRVSVSDVTFGPLSAEESEAYWATGEPVGKAGGYAVQGRAACFIRHIAGSYSGIMGLPLYETAELLAAVQPPLTKIAKSLIKDSSNE
jgi:septum formation protein